MTTFTLPSLYYPGGGIVASLSSALSFEYTFSVAGVPPIATLIEPETTTSTSSSSNAEPTTRGNTTTGTTDSILSTTAAPTPPTVGPTNSPLPTEEPSSGHSDGALAGAAVGCFIGGIFIAAIVAWLLFGRSRKSQSSEATKLLESGGSAKAIAAASPSSTISNAQLEHSLLDTTPDGVIKGELRALGDLIDHHVDANYHLSPVAVGTPELSQSLRQLGFTQKVEAVAIACVRPETRHVGLRHVISHTLFKSIDVNYRGNFSMLPPPVAALLQSMPDDQNDSATSLALSEWRRLSAFLLHPHHGDRTPLPVVETAVRPQALILSDALNSFLHHFVAQNEASRNAQVDHLEGIIIECTKLGYVLLSQPRDWRFVFESGSHDTWVVCAGLDKLGGPESPARRVVEPTVARSQTGS